MNSKELLEKFKADVIEDTKGFIDECDEEDEAEDIVKYKSQIERLKKAKTFGEVASVLNDQAADVFGLFVSLLYCACDDAGENEFHKRIGDIPDHWDT